MAEFYSMSEKAKSSLPLLFLRREITAKIDFSQLESDKAYSGVN